MNRSQIKVATIAAVLVLLQSAGEVSAQSARLYEHITYIGESFEKSGDMSFVGWEWNDRISSVSVPGGMSVTLYEHIDFGGRSLTLTGENHDLRSFRGPGIDGTWNDMASSIKVRTGGAPPPQPQPPPPAPPPPPPTPLRTTVLVNGSKNPDLPEWMKEGSAEFSAIAATYGAPPKPFFWEPNDVLAVTFPLYHGIHSGGFDLARLVNTLPPGEVNVIAHSHGGNVAIWATHSMKRPVRHLINLGTPVNYDLSRGLGAHGAYSRCQISSSSDWTQFWGASPIQVYGFIDNEVRAVRYAWEAGKALLNGDYSSFSYYTGLSAWHAARAHDYFWSTKIEKPSNGRTYVVSGVSHSDLHEPRIWSRIADRCATN
jgi:hypothetical protein